MKLTEALQVLKREEPECENTAYSVHLVCGFTPLHLVTFLAAHLKVALEAREAAITSGLYDDVVGTLEGDLPPDTEGVAVVLEWPDLDPRLGYRRLGGWGPAHELEIVEQVSAALARLGDAIERLSRSISIVVSPPGLPLPPAFHNRNHEAGSAELTIRAELAKFLARLASCRSIAIVNSQWLLEKSPFSQRLDLRGELLTGHPYSLAHDDALAEVLACALRPVTPKKGLITDLDNTLWRDVVGEVGAEAVTWDLEHHAQLHGLYQQFLSSLAAQGVLLGIASKNDLKNVEEVFRIRKLHISREKIFPVEAHWGSKSESIGRILATWNVGADSVVFLDDNPMELAEVKAAWPGVECLLFPKNDAVATLAMLQKLQNMFGKRNVSQEDTIRLASIRAASQLSVESDGSKRQDEFLAQVNPLLTAQFNPPGSDSRTLELVNKTNQFNLNGKRYNEVEWAGMQEAENAFVLQMSYEDKFGPLGKIAVLAGRRDAGTLWIQTWVMSCRAFSRRIEYGCLDLLFAHFDLEEVRFNFASTSKNGPMYEFLVKCVGNTIEDMFVLSRSQFEDKCPPLYFDVKTTQ